MPNYKAGSVIIIARMLMMIIEGREGENKKIKDICHSTCTFSYGISINGGYKYSCPSPPCLAFLSSCFHIFFLIIQIPISMRPSLTKAILFALVVLQCTHLVYSQQQQQQQDQSSGNVVSGQQQTQQQEQQQQQSSSDVPAATSVPAATTTTAAPAVTTTTEAPQPSSTEAPDTKTDATVAPTSTTTTAAPTSDAPVVPSSSSEAGTTSSQSRRPAQPTTSLISSNGSLVPTVITPTDSIAQPTESGAANDKNDGNSGSNKTAVIAGSVVGGLGKRFDYLSCWIRLTEVFSLKWALLSLQASLPG